MNNPPAFPVAYGGGRIEGMTLRDYFAAKAMAALASSPHATQDWINEHLAKSAWRMADVMLKAREA